MVMIPLRLPSIRQLWSRQQIAYSKGKKVVGCAPLGSFGVGNKLPTPKVKSSRLCNTLQSMFYSTAKME